MAATLPAAVTGAAGAPWKSRIQKSLKKNASLAYSRYIQLATVKLDGTPACRTVVFRGFLGDSDDLTLITDQRSNKVQEIARNPAAEVSWYFPISREQYRLTGTLTVVGPQHPDPQLLKARQSAWDRLSEAGRSQFSWPQPGLPRDPDSTAFSQPPAEANQPPLDPFCLVVLRVSAVDYIQLFKNLRSTFSQSQDGTWTETNVNP